MTTVTAEQMESRRLVELAEDLEVVDRHMKLTEVEWVAGEGFKRGGRYNLSQLVEYIDDDTVMRLLAEAHNRIRERRAAVVEQIVEMAEYLGRSVP